MAFHLECSDKKLNIQDFMSWKQALNFVKSLPNRKYNAKSKTWSTQLASDSVIQLLPKDDPVAPTIKEFAPNKYQKAAIDHIVASKPGSKTVIWADAGTGKTATIATLKRFTNESIGAVAFNKSVATELTNRGISGYTFNSFGNKPLGYRRVDENCYYNEIKSIVDYKTERHIINPVIALFEKSRNMLSRKYADLALEFAIDFKSQDENRIYNLVDHLYTICKVDNKVIDYTDQLYLTVTNKLPLPYYDILAIDECQDINPLRYALIQEYISQHPQSKIVWVGDDKQAINGWSGTLDNAINVISDNAAIFPLRLTYRNAQAIIDNVKIAHPNVLTETASDKIGSVQQVTKIDAKDGDMILCKHNAPLVKIALQLVKDGKNVTVKGRDISGFLSYILSKANVKSLDNLSDKLNEFLLSIQPKVAKVTYDNYVDNVDCILAIAEDCSTMDCLYLKIRSIFSNKDGQIILSSIHKAKGLESKNVWLIVTEEKLTLTTGELDGSQDKNLSYVALTRAIENLYLVI